MLIGLSVADFHIRFTLMAHRTANGTEQGKVNLSASGYAARVFVFFRGMTGVCGRSI